MYCNTVYVKQFVNLYFLTKYSMDFKLLKWIFQLLQEKYDKLELDFDSKTKESESYRLDLEKVISELAQVKETMASSKEDNGQLTKELDRLKGEVKVSVGQRWRSDYLVVLVKMYCIYETENNFSWSKFMIIIFINNYCAIWKSMNLFNIFFGGEFQKQEGVIAELKGKLSSAEKEKEAYRIQKEEVLKDKQQVKRS